MNATAEEKRLNFLKGEVPAFESRLTAIKSELESLRKQRDTLKGEIESDKALHNKDVDEKRALIRAENSSLAEGRLKLDADKKEFENILREFKQERLSFDREMQTAKDMKADAQKALDRAGQFFVAVRNLANGL